MANVVAVADVGELEAAQRTEFFFQRKEIRERLAGMKLVGERINHWNVRVGRHFLKDTLVVNARDNALHPALKVASDISDGLPRAERGGCLPVVQENDGATHALRSEEHTSELQSPDHLVCRLLLEKKKRQGRLSQRVTPL